MSPLMMRFFTLVGIALAATSMQLKVGAASSLPEARASLAASAPAALRGSWH